MTQDLVIKKTNALTDFLGKKRVLNTTVLTLLLAFNSFFAFAQNATNSLKINKVEVINESVSGSIDGKIMVTITDANAGNSKYRLAYDFLEEGNSFLSPELTAINGVITLNNARIGPYYNLKVIRTTGNLASAAATSFSLKNSTVANTAGFGETGGENLTCSTIYYTNCAGSSKSISNAIAGYAYNDENSYRPCGLQITSNCNVTAINRWHCFDGNLSIPPTKNKYTVTNYSGAGFTALQACRLNWIVCHYSYNASGVNSAIWYIAGTGGSNNSIAQAAVAAVPAVNGTQTNMVFYNSVNGAYQGMLKWTCVTTPCTGRVNSLYFNELNNGPDLPITNGSSFTLAQLGSLYNLEAGTSGTVGSVKFTITGPTASSNIENAIPYNSPSTGGGAWTGAVGAYSVNLKTYSGSGATGTLCHDTTITFNITNTPPCTGRVNSVYFNELNNGPDLPITNGATFNVSQLGSLYNLEAGTSGTVGSVKYTITGPTPSTNIENTIPYNAPGGSAPWIGAVGNYTVNIKTYNAANATGTLCHDTTITFIIAQLGSIGDKVWYDTNRDGIQDAGENGIKGVTVKLRNASNTVIATDVTDASGNYLFTGLAAGNYSVEFPVTVYGYILSPDYVGSNRNVDSDPSGSTGITPSIALATGQNITNIDAGFAPDCSCVESPSNLLTNASFENGTTGWSWSAANGSLTTGTGYVACGTKNGFNNQSSGTSKVWQDVNIVAGSTVTFSAFAGTHAPGIACSPTLSLIFLNSANAVIGQSNVTVTRVVGDYNDQLEQYSITAVAPAGTAKARVQSSITCNTMKLDAFCLTVSPSCAGGGTWNLNMPNGTLGTSQAYTVNGVTITAYGFNNGNPGTPTTLFGKNDGGNENGVGINSNVNHEIDINHFVQLDLNQVIATNATVATMSIGSMQAGEPANVYGSNTLGVIGTLLMTVPVTLDNTPFPMPGYPAYRYISVRASAPSPADVLLQQVSFSCPVLFGSIGDRVWVDTNKDGIQDAGEVGLAGVVVTLYDGTTNNVVASTVTDAYGNYLFSKLPTSVAGTNYQVRFSLVPGYRFSPSA
ncbi:MAG: SdrD B-like domain-containing protein, partial [Ferruginibacter sp.]